MLPIELTCEIPCKLVLPSHKISIGEDVLAPHFHRLPHTCYGKTLFFRYCRSLLHQQGIIAVHIYAHYGAIHMRREKRRSSLKWVVQVQPDLIGYAMPTSDTTGCFQEHMSNCSIDMSVHMTIKTDQNVAQ